MHGIRLDGAVHQMAGVTISRVEGDRIAWMRFFLEPVDNGTSGVEAAVRQTPGAGSAGTPAGTAGPR